MHFFRGSRRGIPRPFFPGSLYTSSSGFDRVVRVVAIEFEHGSGVQVVPQNVGGHFGVHWGTSRTFEHTLATKT
jgi:hypothetical protein